MTQLTLYNCTAERNRGAEIDHRISLKYPKREENAITRHMLVDPVKYADEFHEYNDFAERVKAEVRAEAEALLSNK